MQIPLVTRGEQPVKSDKEPRYSPTDPAPPPFERNWDRLVTPALTLATTCFILLEFYLLLFFPDGQAEADEARRSLYASCQGSRRSSTVSMNALAAGARRLIEKSVNQNLDATKGTILFSLKVIQRIVEFVIGICHSFSTTLVDLSNPTKWTFTPGAKKVGDAGGVRAHLDSVISTPFSRLESQIKESFGHLKFTGSTLPILHEQEFTFCDSLDVSIIDDLGRNFERAKWRSAIFVAYAMVLSVLAILFYARYTVQSRSQAPLEKSASDPSSNPSLTNATLQIELEPSDASQLNARPFHLGTRNRNHIRFLSTFIWYPMSLGCIFTGTVGWVMVQVQLVALGPHREHYTGLIRDWVDNLAPALESQIKIVVAMQSSIYARLIKARLGGLQGSVDGVVTDWVNGAVIPVKNIISVFYGHIQSAVEKVPGGTAPDGMVRQFADRVVRAKPRIPVPSVLAFVRQHFQAKVPEFGSDVLVLDDSAIKEISESFFQDVVGVDGRGDGGIVARMVDQFAAALERERARFQVLLIVGGVTFVLGVWSSHKAHNLFVRRNGSPRDADIGDPTSGASGEDEAAVLLEGGALSGTVAPVASTPDVDVLPSLSDL